MRAAVVEIQKELNNLQLQLVERPRRDDPRAVLGDRFLAVRLQLNANQSIHVCGRASFGPTGSPDRAAKDRNKTKMPLLCGLMRRIQSAIHASDEARELLDRRRYILDAGSDKDNVR